MEVLKMPWRPDPDPYAPGRREFLLQEELEGRLEQAIIAAVEEERTTCEEIAQMYVNLIREVGFPEKGVAELIRNAIMKRARSEEKK
jgi:hypothetical protein